MLEAAVEINEHGWLWPKGDRFTWPTVKGELAEIPELVSLCQNKRVCVQAGGNGGLWPDHLAQLFDTVYTFEPDPINFRCLVHNVARDNVVFMQAALGEQASFIAMDRWCGPQNPGANRVQSGGHIPVLALDSLKLEDVDLLQLDIEGYELNALRGAEETIARCRPVICLELRNHSHHFGTNDDSIRSWVRDRGYELVKRVNYDEFWVPST